MLAAIEHASDALDDSGVGPGGGGSVIDRQLLVHELLEDGIEHVVGRQALVVALAGAQLRGGGLEERGLGDGTVDSVGVEPSSEGVDLVLPQVGDDGEAPQVSPYRVQ